MVNHLSPNLSAALTSNDSEQVVKDVILNNPKIIVQSLEEYQKQAYKEEIRNLQGKVKDKSSQLYNNSADPKAGNLAAKVKVVEFFDYNCGYCKRMLKSKKDILAEDKDVLFIFKELPVLGENSTDLAKAALAVYSINPDKYFAFHSEMLSYEGSNPNEHALHMVKKLGLDLNEFNKAKSSDKVKTMLEDNFTLAKEIGLRGTPAYVIGDEALPGALSYQGLKSKINEHKAR